MGYTANNPTKQAEKSVLGNIKKGVIKMTKTKKSITDMSTLTIQLEKAFDMLNADIFESKLSKPVITVVPTKGAYGHYTLKNMWVVNEQGKREINISSYTLKRSLLQTITTLVHEMVHMYNDTVLGVTDCSRKGYYHNKHFKKCAEEHWLICEKCEMYGWAETKPSEKLVEWINNHKELKEIEMYHIGVMNSKGGTDKKAKSHSHKYVCPKCRNIARTTKVMGLICKDCKQELV